MPKKYWLGWAAELIAGTAPVSSKNMAEQNNYNRQSQSYLRQGYVNFSFGVEPLFNMRKENTIYMKTISGHSLEQDAVRLSRISSYVRNV